MDFLDAMISERDLLSFWEISLDKPLLERGLWLVYLANPTFDFGRVASMPIGERDAQLLAIRENLFGPVFDNTTNCPKCKQKVEWETTVDAVRMPPKPDSMNGGLHSLEYNGNHIQFRLPNSTDILEVLSLKKGISKEKVLLRRCIEPSSLPADYANELPEALENALVQKMEACDPQADIIMAILCPECGHNWDITFDIVSYLWAEIDDWATHLIQDVFGLAKNFGWSENDILEMGSFRRSLYLKMLYG